MIIRRERLWLRLAVVLLYGFLLAPIAILVATGLGTMASLWLARSAGAVRDLLRVLVVSPLAVPGILTGIALLIFFYALGWTKTGLGGLVIGHTLITLPYVFLITSAVL